MEAERHAGWPQFPKAPPTARRERCSASSTRRFERDGDLGDGFDTVRTWRIAVRHVSCNRDVPGGPGP